MQKDIQKSYDRFCEFMEKNTLGTEIACYTVALTGLTLALRRVRPFSKFKRPVDVPNRFIKERKELIGTVKRIEPNGTLLMLNHKPLIDVPFIKTGELPIKIAGINVRGHGISWLQTIVAGKEVTCIPLRKEKDFLECTVSLQQHTSDKKARTINVGESLVAVGFASLAKPVESTSKDSYIRAYLRRLQSAEIRALKKQLGLKYYLRPIEAVFLNSIRRIVASLQKQLTTKMQKVSQVPVSS